MPVPRWTRAQLLGKTVRWLLAIEYGGKVIRVSTLELDVPSEDGDLHFSSGLGDVSYSRGVAVFSDAASENSATVEASIDEVDIATMVADGHDLGGARAELSRWIEGTTWEDRRVVLSGLLRDPEYGDQYTPLRFSLEDNVWDDAGSVPPADQQVNETTAPNLDYLTASDIGVPFPRVYGQPGRVAPGVTGNGNWCTGSLTAWQYKRGDGGTSDYHRVILAGHAIDAEYVYLNNDGYTAGILFKVTHVADRAGNTLAVVDAWVGSAGGTTGSGVAFEDGLDGTAVDASFKPLTAEDVAIYAGWYDPETGHESYGGLPPGAGDVILDALSFSTRRIDRNRIMALAPLLNRFRLDVAIEAHTKPWEWLAANVFPLLPVSAMLGPDGYYLAHWNYAATSRDSLATLDADTDPEIDFADTVKYDTSQVANDFTLDYALSRRTGSFLARARLSAFGGAAERHATCVLEGPYGSMLLLTAAGVGGAGQGIEISFTAAGALSVADTGPKSVAITGPATDSTTIDALAAAINSGSALVSASILPGQVGSNTVVCSATLGYGVNDHGIAQTVTTRLATSTDYGASYFCELSQRRYKNVLNPTGVAAKRAETICVYDKSTAEAILGWWAQAYCFAWRTVDCVVPEMQWDWLEPGNVVTLNSTRLGLRNQVALVLVPENYDDGTLGLRFLLLENPPRDSRVTS